MIDRIASRGVTREMSVLLVDGDFQSSVTLSRVFRELGLLERLMISTDCGQALSHLHEANVTRPDLILLALDIPGRNSFDMLRTLKSDALCSTIPVVVLAQTNDAEEVSACYGLGVAGYMLKSDDYPVLVERIRAICTYWAVNRLPNTN